MSYKKGNFKTMPIQQKRYPFSHQVQGKSVANKRKFKG